MTNPNVRYAPKPHETLSDEGGSVMCWLAEAWSQDDICEEWELTPEKLREEWWACRWTTDEEKADPDVLYDLFGDYEYSRIDTSVVYWRVKADTPGAHKYWTNE
jgi:hypothetical protein